MKRFFHLAWKPAIRRHAFIIAATVGTALNLVNQLHALLALQNIAWGPLVMNFLVPYCVATYSAVKNELSHAATHHAD